MTIRDVPDGTSSTYLLGEKNVNPDMYENGLSGGDDQSLFNGHNSDVLRSTHLSVGPPRPDTKGFDLKQIFGSAHSGGCNFAFCDGSVRSIGYTVAPEAHWYLGVRNDGQTVDDEEL